MDATWAQYLGKRLLLSYKRTDAKPPASAFEAVLCEIATQSGFLKLNPVGWVTPDRLELIEILSEQSVIDLQNTRLQSMAAQVEDQWKQLAAAQALASSLKDKCDSLTTDLAAAKSTADALSQRFRARAGNQKV